MKSDNDRIEVIYIAYRPDAKLYESVSKMESQLLKPDRIRIVLTVDTPADADQVREELKKRDLNERIVVESVEKSDFSHGGTRQNALKSSDCGYVLLMTQDAVPADDELVSRLFEAVSKEDAALAYARQRPYQDAGKVERLYRNFNYPKKSASKTASDIEKTGVKAFFSSDVCCMYKRSVFDAVGGFDRSADFNEDSIYAYHCLKAGYTVEYVAEARVYHSHNMTFRQMFERSRLLASSQKKHPEIFRRVSSEHEGLKFLKLGIRVFLKRRDYRSLLDLFATCTVKYAGYFVGKRQ